jgi:DHA3 family macrolide efflux protein-like MFS transporter
MRTFTIIWSGQLISFLGSELCAFAVAVWVFQSTGSVTNFTLIGLATLLPGILLSPLAGTLVDRWDYRRALILSDCGAGLGIGLIALLLYTGHLALWHIYVLLSLRSCFTALRFPALGASVTLLVGKRHLDRANGMLQLAEAVGRVTTPALAGFLMTQVELWGILLFDVLTFLVSMGTLFAVRFPRRETGPEAAPADRSLVRETAAGWRYVAERRGLLSLVFLMAGGNFTLGTIGALLSPMVLAFATEPVLGLVMSIGNCGFLLSGGLTSLWGGPRHRVRAILALKACEGLSLMVLGAAGRSVPLTAAAAFFLMFNMPIIMTASHAIWQTKVPLQLQGRAFAIRRMISWSTLPLAYLVAGPLADRFFEPLMASGGALAGTVGQWIEVGRGRGIGLYFVLLGLLQVVLVAAASTYRPLRRLEEEIPDALADAPPPPAAAAVAPALARQR